MTKPVGSGVARTWETSTSCVSSSISSTTEGATAVQNIPLVSFSIRDNPLDDYRPVALTSHVMKVSFCGFNYSTALLLATDRPG